MLISVDSLKNIPGANRINLKKYNSPIKTCSTSLAIL